MINKRLGGINASEQHVTPEIEADSLVQRVVFDSNGNEFMELDIFER
jgi:hypothetical protein